MVSSSDAKAAGLGSGIPVSLAGASTTLFEAILSVSIARLKCTFINCSAFNGVSIDA